MSIFLHLKLVAQRRVKMWRCFFVCATVLALTSLGACTTVPVFPSVASTALTGEPMFAQHFLLSGRISVRVNDKIDSGQIRWYRRPQEERIGLYTPLGSQVAELVSDKDTRMVTLRQGSETVTAASVAELTQSLLGAPLDLDRMAAWVQGIGLRENEITDATLANGDSWRVTAERYQSSGNYRFASRVIATKGEIVVRLVIDEWVPQ